MITDPGKAMGAQFYLQARFKEDGVLIVFAGLMDVAQRWDVIRRAIEHYRFRDKQISKSDTYGSAFERATGQTMEQKAA